MAQLFPHWRCRKETGVDDWTKSLMVMTRPDQNPLPLKLLHSAFIVSV